MRLLPQNFLWKTDIFDLDCHKIVLKNWHVSNSVDICGFKKGRNGNKRKKTNWKLNINYVEIITLVEFLITGKFV